MPTFVSQDDFDALLAQDEPDLSPQPVFVQPKITERGYYTRRERLLRYQARQTTVIQELQAQQREATKLERQAERVTANIAALEKAKADSQAATEAAGREFDASSYDQQIAEAQDEIEKLEEQGADIAGKVEGLVTQSNDIFAEQVELILPYIKAIKYPQPDETVKYWMRPKEDGPDLAEFEDAVRPLLRDASEEAFQGMLDAIRGTGNGARAVPRKSGSR